MYRKLKQINKITSAGIMLFRAFFPLPHPFPPPTHPPILGPNLTFPFCYPPPPSPLPPLPHPHPLIPPYPSLGPAQMDDGGGRGDKVQSVPYMCMLHTHTYHVCKYKYTCICILYLWMYCTVLYTNIYTYTETD